MTMPFIDILDTALDQLYSGEPIPAILARYPAHTQELAPLLHTTQALAHYPPVELPTQEALTADRDAFVAAVARRQRQTESLGLGGRLARWIVHPFSRGRSTTQPQKQRLPLLLARAALILTLLVVSVGGAVAWSANSLPDSPLYTLKLAHEHLRLNLAAADVTRATLHLELAQERLREMERLAQAGHVPGPDTQKRLQTHVDQGLHLAAGLSDGALLAWLSQAQQAAQAGERRLHQAQSGATKEGQARLEQARMTLHQLYLAAESGIQDPQTFRWRYGAGHPPRGTPAPSLTPGRSRDTDGGTPQGTPEPQPNGRPEETREPTPSCTSSRTDRPSRTPDQRLPDASATSEATAAPCNSGTCGPQPTERSQPAGTPHHACPGDNCGTTAAPPPSDGTDRDHPPDAGTDATPANTPPPPAGPGPSDGRSSPAPTPGQSGGQNPPGEGPKRQQP